MDLANALEPFAYAFFQKGFLVAGLSGALLGFIGVYITLRGMSYIGHGLSHAIFGGFAGGICCAGMRQSHAFALGLY